MGSVTSDDLLLDGSCTEPLQLIGLSPIYGLLSHQKPVFFPSMSPKELENQLQANHPKLFGNIWAQVLG
jgi:hypothetical protein